MEHQIKLGDCLGKGAFGSVYRVESPFWGICVVFVQKLMGRR